jgi:hypothetical protein
VLTDGGYLAAWPLAGAVAAPAALVLGLVLGWRPWSTAETFTSSLPGVLLLVAIASLGAGLGAWATGGFVLGDLLLHTHAVQASSALEGVVVGTLPRFIGYLLLSVVLVLIPLLSVTTARRTIALVRSRGARRPPWVLPGVLGATTVGALTWAWVHTVPTLIRPVYTWSGGQPPVAAVEPLQRLGWWLVATAALVTAARVAVESTAITLPRPRLAGRPVSPGGAGSRWASVALRTAVTTFILAGLFTDWWQAVAFAVFFALVLALRGVLTDRGGRYVAVITRVPLAIRLAIAVAVSYVVGRAIVGQAWASTQTFGPILASAATGLLVGGLLLPVRSTAAASPSTPPPAAAPGAPATPPPPDAAPPPAPPPGGAR